MHHAPAEAPSSVDKDQAALIADLPRQLAIRVLGPDHLATDRRLLEPDDWWRLDQDDVHDNDLDEEKITEAVEWMADPDEVDPFGFLQAPSERPELSGADRTKAFLAWQVGGAVREALEATSDIDPRQIVRGGAVIDFQVGTHLDHGDHVRTETKMLEAILGTLRKLLGGTDRPSGRITFTSVLSLSESDGEGDPPTSRFTSMSTPTIPTRTWHSSKVKEAVTLRPSRHRIAKEILEDVSIGHFVVCLTDRNAQMPPEVEVVLNLRAVLEPLTREDLIGLVGLTHGVAGEAEENDLHERMPSDEELRRLSTASVLAALAGPTPAAVAERLAKLAGIEETRRLLPAQAADPKPVASASTVSAGSDAPRLTLADVKGQDAVVEELRGIAADVTLWRCGALAWSDLVSSVILHGPPGTGKTMAAEALAGELDIPLIDASIGTAQSKGPLSSVLKAFEEATAKAEKSAPCVLVMDELDSLMPRDNERDNGYMRLLVNAVLEALTRIQSMEGVVLIGATNGLGMIDPAIRRSGRFDLKLRMASPDLAGIRAIVRAGLGDDAGPTDSLAFDAALNALAGCSGADAAMVARRAKGLARRRAVETNEPARVSSADVAMAVTAIVPPLDPDDLRRIAIHETGHALIGAISGLGLPRFVRIVGDRGIAALPIPAIRTPAILRAQLMTALAGREAERLIYGDVCMGAASDLAMATMLLLEAERQCGMGEHGLAWEPVPVGGAPLSTRDRTFVNERLEVLAQEVGDLLVQHRAALLTIADRLVADRDLDAATIETLLAPFAKNQLPEWDADRYLSDEARGDYDDTHSDQDPSHRRLTPVSRARQAPPSHPRTLP